MYLLKRYYAQRCIISYSLQQGCRQHALSANAFAAGKPALRPRCYRCSRYNEGLEPNGQRVTYFFSSSWSLAFSITIAIRTAKGSSADASKSISSVEIAENIQMERFHMRAEHCGILVSLVISYELRRAMADKISKEQQQHQNFLE